MALKALIVDDEYAARQELRYLLEQFNNVEIVGEAAGAREALKLLQALEYDLLFLDINLPGINGLELAANLQKFPKKPHVVFITAYENYAVDAFGVDAVDYILKPINKPRLKRAIDKVVAKENMTGREHDTEENKSGDSAYVPENSPVAAGPEELMTNRIIAESKGKITLVNVNEIFYAYTEGDAVFIKTFAERMLTRFTLKELEARLHKSNFFRTHRSYIVNIYKVKEILPFFNGTYTLVLEDQERSEVPVSRIQAKKLRKILGY